MLFDDNLGFFGFAVPKNMKISSDSDLTSIVDGFSKGNMFNNLYDPYKNYKYERVRNIVKKILLVSIPIALTAVMSSLNKNIDSFTVVRSLKQFMSEDMAISQYGILGRKSRYAYKFTFINKCSIFYSFSTSYISG